MITDSQESDHPFVQKGYDAWVKIWADDQWPTPRDCGARWLPEGSEERAAYIKGWNRARREVEGESK